MRQYPHILKTKDQGTIGTDEDGFPENVGFDNDGFGQVPDDKKRKPNRRGTGNQLDRIRISCREVPNNSGSFVNTEAGEKIVYGSKIYLPRDTQPIKATTEIVVMDSDDETVRIKGRVIRFAKYQLDCVIWV